MNLLERAEVFAGRAQAVRRLAWTIRHLGLAAADNYARLTACG